MCESYKLDRLGIQIHSVSFKNYNGDYDIWLDIPYPSDLHPNNSFVLFTPCNSNQSINYMVQISYDRKKFSIKSTYSYDTDVKIYFVFLTPVYYSIN